MAIEPSIAAKASVPAEMENFTGPLVLEPADPLLSLIALHRADPRAFKVDLGVGVYRDEAGRTPVMNAVKQAERMLVRSQSTKAYLGAEGDIRFGDLIFQLVAGEAHAGTGHVAVQTPGGTGALRLAAEFVARTRPGARIWLGTPTWPNHAPTFHAARLETKLYPFFDVAQQRIDFDRVREELGGIRRHDVVLLHGCCHNPTGADFSVDQAAAILDLVEARGALLLVDLAYHGLGHGLGADSAVTRLALDRLPELLIAYSCDKNFGLYRDRVGALLFRSRSNEAAEITRSNLLLLARTLWSMPPDHGAAVVREILESPTLSAAWRTELDGMRERLGAMRSGLADAVPALDGLRHQKGLFATLPLSPDDVRQLRETSAIYMAGSGRMNVAGLQHDTLARVAEALREIL